MATPEVDTIDILARMNVTQYAHTDGTVRAFFALLSRVGDTCTTPQIQDEANLHRSHASFFLHTLGELGLAEKEPEYSQKAKRYLTKWQIGEEIVDICAEYNQIYASTVQQQLSEKLDPVLLRTREIARLSLHAFAVCHRAPQALTTEGVITWAQQEKLLHPQQTIHRALGSFAAAHDVDRETRLAIQTRIKAQQKTLTEPPMPRRVIPRQADGNQNELLGLRASSLTAPTSTTSRGHGLTVGAPALRQE